MPEEPLTEPGRPDAHVRAVTCSDATHLLVTLAIGATLAILMWQKRGKDIQDVALWGIFLYSLLRAKRAAPVWRSIGGVITLSFLALAIILIPFGVDPGSSLKGLLQRADFVAFGLAMPVVLGTPKRLLMALSSGAIALTLVISKELGRLFGLYGFDIVAKARWDEGSVLNHVNTASMAAAIAAIILVYAAWQQRRVRPVCALLVIAALVDLFYVVAIRSRSVQIALFAAPGLALFLAARGRMRAVLAITATLCLVAIVMCNPRFRNHGALGGLVDRDKVWHHTLKLVSERPISGYGFGEDVFLRTYHASNPPRSRHHFYHPHQYWINALFVYGWVGAGVQALMWVALVGRLGRRLWRGGARDDVLPAMILSLVIFFQIVGLVDCLPNVIALALIWSIPAALIATAPRTEGAA